MRPWLPRRKCKRCKKKPVKRPQGLYCGRLCMGEDKRSATLRERLERRRKINKNGCWIWTGSLIHDGYGLLGYKGKGLRVHRASWVVYRGSIPKGKSVLHDCPGGDNPACFNPDHLWLGTHQDNMKDMVKKGRFKQNNRYPTGEKHPLAVLTDEKVKRIRRKLLKGATHLEIHQEFGIAKATVYQIASGKTWKHVSV